MEKESKPQLTYGTIIGEYIDAINSQNFIVPISYKFLSAQILSESNKLEKYCKEHGQIFSEDGKKCFRMSVEHRTVFEKMMSNLDNTVQANYLVGVNAVIGMVSKYDGYLGRLTKQLLKDKPEILNGSEREFKASDILTYKDYDELKDVLVEKEIETLLRKNHIEQLQWFEKQLGIKLREFKVLPNFVEVVERRNLFVHCNGVVSRQYLSECRKAGATLPDDIKVGDTLWADLSYVRKAYSVLFQVGVMLGFVLWHKLKPEDIEELVDRLSDVPFNLIRDEQYSLSIQMIDFALSIKSWEKDIKHVYQLVFMINKALAFHLLDKQEECEKIVKELDVSASEPVYHLAVAVLLKEYDQAYELMDAIGAQPQMRVNYKTWPLFSRIRQEAAFSAKYREIFSEEYECNDAKLSDFEDILKSAAELVKKTKAMHDEAQEEDRKTTTQ